MGALVVLVIVQLSVTGLYLPPLFKKLVSPKPPHTIISLPVHTALGKDLCEGVDAVGVQLSVAGSYLPPVFRSPSAALNPPHTIISLPVQTALCDSLTEGTLVVLVAVQLSVPGLYLPPVFESPPPPRS